MSRTDPASPARIRALVLAGRRSADDPLAEATGVAHRALVEVGGVPSLVRVIDTLFGSGRVEQVVVPTDAPELIAGTASLERRIADGSVRVTPSAASPAQTVLQGLEELGSSQPVLVTTADHALLSPQVLCDFLDAARAQRDADLLLAMVPERILRARFGESKRTYLPLRGERYSGANLFLFENERALRAARFWMRAEADRKRPWKYVRLFGLGSLLLFALRQLDLAAAMERASRVIGATVVAIELDAAEAAIDVDSVEDWKLANEIVATP